MTSDELAALDAEWVMPTYNRAPVEFVRGEGTMLWDADGKEYLDFLGGISVCSLGHCHPRVVEAVREQAGTLTHTSNLYMTRPGAELARKLCESSIGGKAFLCNSGAEANECAIKLVRKHAYGRGIAEPEIVVLEGAFHGRTMGAVSATPAMAANESFAPYLPGFVAVPRDDPDALCKAVGEQTAAVMIEPIQGESGVVPVSDDVLAAAREACDASGALLVLDEIQTGMGRTGSLWAYEQTPVRPDVMTTAKALGGGLPAGACVAAPEFADTLQPGDHGSTFAGGPLVAAAARVALEVTDDPELLRGVRETGARLREGLEAIDGVRSTRGRGLMIGVALAEGIDSAAVASAALEQGLVVNPPRPDTIRLLPPLNVSTGEVDRAVGLLSGAIRRSEG
jgi:predicted acetylornithine/succinylornithine family transaminase